VRNYQARNFMRDGMREGDGILFYHSSCAEPGVVGIAEVASAAYPDPTQFQRKSKYFDPASKPDEPRWMLVDVRFVRKLRRIITLAELKASDELEDFALLRRGNRLSVMPVGAAHWRFILNLEGS
jgi:predicted RNA-binding protein with PUA-like domain